MIDSTENRYKVQRGSKLPHSKLDEEKVKEIHSIVERRNKLKAELSLLTNKKIAQRMGVHVRTIDRVTALENWTHV